MSTQKELYLNMGPYHEVISGIVLILSISDGVVKVTGLEGTGKTSLLKELQNELGNEDQQAILFENSPSTVQEIHDVITRELKLAADTSFRKALSRHILSRSRDQQSLIVIFDEAHHLDAEKLEAISRLREIKDNDKALVSVVLGGEPELNAMLSREESQALANDITVSYELKPLTRDQLSEFCRDLIFSRKLKIPGPEGQRLDQILTDTGGLPGNVVALLINATAADTATLDADGELQDADTEAASTSETVKAARVIDEEEESALSLVLARLAGIAKPVAVLGVLAGVGYFLYPQVLPLIDRFTSGPAQPEVVTIPTPAAPVQPVTETPVELPAAETTEAAPATQVPDPAELLASVEPQAEPIAPTPADEPVITQQAPPQPAPTVTPLPAQPLVTLNQANQAPTQAELLAVVDGWLDAWQTQDLDSYFSFYHTDFAPLYQNTRSSWREDRSNSVGNPASIAISSEDFSVTGATINGFSVQFWLNYQSPTYADRTLKELVLGRDTDGQFRILQEINREVTAPTRTFVAVQPAGSNQTGTRFTAVAAEPIAVGMTAENAVATPNSAQTEEINNFLLQWLTAWQNKDLNGYFRHYHPQYKSASMATVEAWRNDRILKITRPDTIHIRLEDMDIVDIDNSSSLLTLTMEYHSSFYADRTDKEMRLQRTQDGSWQITLERNIAVVTLPLARLVPTNRVAARVTNRSVVEFKL
jgi:type II secretory pathway predicted ATPase ExeA